MRTCVVLKAKINGLASKCKKINDVIRKIKYSNLNLDTKNKYIQQEQYVKSIVKYETRSHHLAYAFVNDIAYSKLERKANIAPDVRKIAKIVQEVGYVRTRPGQNTGMPVIYYYSSDNDKLIARIKLWLKGENDVVD